MPQPQFTRPMVIELLRAAFHQAAYHDYRFKYIENEEDLRACVFRHLRDALDLDPRWRVFLSYSSYNKNQQPNRFKPDMIILCGEQQHAGVRLEILVELKNWPKTASIERDIEKLCRMHRLYAEDNPDIVFFGVVNSSVCEKAAIVQKQNELRDLFPSPISGHVWLEHHDELYRGPWDAVKNTDPYREKMRRLLKKQEESVVAEASQSPDD